MRSAFRLSVPLLFVLAWAPTLTPIYRLYGFGTRTAISGIIEGALLSATLGAILLAGARTRRSSLPAFATALLGTALAGWLVLLAAAAALEPSRDRSAAAQRLSPASPNGGPAPARVLLICVDGMDWNAIDRLLAVNVLPAISQVLSRARTYQVDNHGLGLSPGIWARAYTGATGDPIQGFTKWRLRGTERGISVLPQWRHRPLFRLDRALNAAAQLDFWEATSPTNMDFVHPPLWRVAAAAGARVGVFDPLPFDVVGEQTDGFFAWQSDEGFQIAASNGHTSPAMTRFRDETSSESFDGVIRSESMRAQLAAGAFARHQPAIGIYYTHVLDAIGHMVWEPGGGAAAAADVREERVKPFTEGRTAAAYQAVDASIRGLTEGFGPSTVVIVSDHGWEFSADAHRTAPFGVAMFAGTRAAGYGGTMAIERVAGTVLALARVPVPTAMAAPLQDVVEHWTPCQDCAPPVPRYLTTPREDRERRDRLRSLGYTTR